LQGSTRSLNMALGGN